MAPSYEIWNQGEILVTSNSNENLLFNITLIKRNTNFKKTIFSKILIKIQSLKIVDRYFLYEIDC